MIRLRIREAFAVRPRTSVRFVMSKADAVQKLSRTDSPCFAYSTSSDLRPRIAAREAFDVAAAALPHRPNFCVVNVSMDHADMMEAPSAMWGALNEQLEAGSAPPTMIGQIVRSQRFGGQNFLEVMLGYVPQLTAEAFTFDQLPNSVDPHAFLGITLVDWRLTKQHLPALNQRIAALCAVCPCPVVGGVLPPASNHDGPEAESEESSFCFNDNLYKGSACGIVLSSPAMQSADVLASVPSGHLQDNCLVECDTTDVGPYIWTIRRLNGMPAASFVRKTYETASIPATSKIFVGVHINGCEVVVPCGFIGDSATESISVTLPSEQVAKHMDRSKVSMLFDDPASDKVSVASQLLSFRNAKETTMPTFEEYITIARECRKKVTVSSSAVLHWSSPSFYEVAERPDHGIALRADGSLTTELHAPSIAARCCEGFLPTAGIHCGGQILPLAGPGSASGFDHCSSIAARSSVHVMLRGKD